MVFGTETASPETAEDTVLPDTEESTGALASATQPEGETAEAKTEQAEGPTAEELQGRLAKAEESLQKLQARYDSVVGSSRGAAEQRAMLNRMMATQQAIIEHLDNPDSEPGSLKKRVASLTDEMSGQLAARETRNEWLAEVAANMERVGLTGREPEFAEAGRLWQEAKGDSETPDLRLLHKAVVSANAAVYAHERKQGEQRAQEAMAKAETQRKQGNQAGRTLGAGAPNGRGGGVTVTKDNIDQLFNQGKVTSERYQKFLSTGDL